MVRQYDKVLRAIIVVSNHHQPEIEEYSTTDIRLFKPAGDCQSRWHVTPDTACLVIHRIVNQARPPHLSRSTWICDHRYNPSDPEFH